MPDNRDLLIRRGRATIADLDELDSLEKKIFTGIDELFSRPRLRYLLSSPNSAVFVCFHEGAAIGYGIALKNRLTNRQLKGRIYSLGLLSGWQRKGAGKVLLGELEKWLIDAGVAFITLETRADSLGAKDFFERMGYQVSDILPKYYPESDGIRMIKRINRNLHKENI